MAIDDPTQATIPLVYVPDWKDIASDQYLLSQFRDLPRWRALVRGLAAGVQQAEDAFFDLLNGIILANAYGDALDKWGSIVGEQRGGLGDFEFRQFISARILVNISGGTPDEMIAIAEIVTAPSTVRLFNLPPAYFKIEIVREEAMSDALVRRVVRMLTDAKPAGVGMGIIEAVEGFFGFDGDPGALGYDVGVFARKLS